MGPPTRLGIVPEGQKLDSLAVQADGRICVATIGNGGISRFDLDGEVEHFSLPDPMVTNICFGGEDGNLAFVTAAGTGRVMKLSWPEPGAPLAF